MHWPRNHYTRGTLKISPHLLNTAFTFHCYITHHHTFRNAFRISEVQAGWTERSARVSGWSPGVGRPRSSLPEGPRPAVSLPWAVRSLRSLPGCQLKAMCFSPYGASILNQQMMLPPVWNLWLLLAWENSAQRVHMINNVINNDTWLLNGATIALESHIFVQRHL